MNIFSFCIYGTEVNYYSGLLENIQIIREYFPDFEIYIYKGICDPSWTFEKCKIIETGKSGLVNTLYRFLPLADAEVGFVRDADSRINERDRWCIQEFMKSDKNYHIIRDHYWHKSLIMAGMFGWKKPCSEKIIIPESEDLVYGFEEKYLGKTIYPVIKSESLVHTNNHALAGEYAVPITIPHKDQYDFVGNVIWNDRPKFEYFLGDMLKLFIFLREQDQFGIIKYLSDRIEPLSIPYKSRTALFECCYTSNFYLRDVEKCQYWLSQFEFAEISPSVIHNSNYLFLLFNSDNKHIVATFDSERMPSDNEIVIVYGNYPDWHHALPHSSKMYRHASMFTQIRHNSIEYDSVWEPIDTIYILNLKERSDRFNDTLLALCSVKAPIHRIYHYKAEKGELPPYVGATKNHVDVMKHFKESGKSNCLILEDDIVFIDDHRHITNTFQQFFSRNYQYNICFLSLSKHGEKEPMDDILSVSKQECTTSSAYLLNSNSIETVLQVAEEGLLRMSETGDHHNYCIDRYWTKLSDLFFFKKKLVFQRPSFSNLTKCVNFNLD